MSYKQTLMSGRSPHSTSLRSGFTIVELLVVIVVIGILAAITIVSYNGITSRAIETTIKTDLQTASTLLALDYAQNGSYPDDAASVNGGTGLKASGDNTLTYHKEYADFCVTGANPRLSQPFYLTGSNTQIRAGSCGDAGNVWIARSTPSGAWRSIAYGNGTFMAVADGDVGVASLPSTRITSKDAITWSTSAPMGTVATTLAAVMYDGSRFVAKTSAGRVDSVLSVDVGSTWQNATPAELVGTYLGTDIAYGNGIYVATKATPPSTYSSVFTSANGLTWTSRSASPVVGATWYGIAFGNGKFVAVGNGTPRVMTSTDGIAWTAQTAPAANYWSDVTFGDGKFVAVAKSGTNRAMVSTDGVTWTLSNPTEENTWTSVAYGSGKFVAVASSGTNRVMTSTDGITWTPRTAAEANSWEAVTYGNGCFVAAASSGTNRVMTSCW